MDAFQGIETVRYGRLLHGMVALVGPYPCGLGRPRVCYPDDRLYAVVDRSCSGLGLQSGG